MELIEKRLSALLPESRLPYKALYEAARYSLLDGGKRLRPQLALAAAEAFGAPKERALDPACALEMVHTYSLIHDDLPCMDNDDLRRGKPTLHRAFGEAQAVLAGDFLLTRAFEVLAEAPDLTEGQRLRLIRRLAQSAGGEGMIGGQLLDLQAEKEKSVEANVELIHRKKTGAMITASLLFGGIVADAPAAEMRLLETLGGKIGLAFQIIDDILDVTADPEQLGKTAASDISNNKTTYVSTLGLEKARRKAEQLHGSAKELLATLPGNSAPLMAVAEKLAARSH